MKKKLPVLENEEAERAFWASHDPSEYLDWSKAKQAIFRNLKPTTHSISLCLPASILDELRQMANQRDVPYQSLIKVFLRERMDQEYRSPSLAKGGSTYRARKTE